MLQSTDADVQDLKRRLDDGAEPVSIEIRPTIEGRPVIEITFRPVIPSPNEFRFALDEAREITDERDALVDVEDALFVGLRYDDTAEGHLVYDKPGVYLIHGVDRDREESASYTEVFEGFVNPTRHPDHHLPMTHGESERVFLIDPDQE